MKLIAHRGYRRRHPENSLSAICEAIECGAKLVEIDVHLTADHIPVLLHDDTLDRMCGVGGAIHEQTFDALPLYSVSEATEPESIASLQQCVELLEGKPEVHLFVELKESAAERFGERLVVAGVLEVLRPIIQRCTIISFSTEMLREVERQSQVTFGLVIRDWSERKALEDFERRPAVLFCDLKGLPKSGDVTIEGIAVAVFEVPDLGVALELARRGVTYAETFQICELLAGLASG